VVLLDLNTDEEKTYRIVGVDEADLKHGKISVTSPVARALIGRREGDEVTLEAPGGTHEFEVLEVRYE
jgi:transcription elongation factor GreA